MNPAPDTSTLAQLWHRLLLARGGECAVLNAEQSAGMTFSDIDALTQSLRTQLRHAGIGTKRTKAHTQTVLLCLPNGAHWLAAYLSLALEEVCIVPVEPESNATLTAAKCQRLAEQLHASALIDTNGIHPLPAHGTDACPAQQHSSNSADSTVNAESTSNTGSAGTQVIKLTSGSTGVPQALAFTEANMLADARNICTSMGIRADSVNYAVIPFGHSYGLGNIVYPFFMQGTPIVCGTSILPRVAAAEIERCGATVLPTVPTLARAMNAAQLPPSQLQRLERIICAGSVLQPAVAQAFHRHYGKRLHNFYGSSETGAICFDADGEATLNGTGIGRPVEGVSVDLSPERCVRVRSAAVCAELNTDGNGVVLQDRAELLADGGIRLLGRIGATIKIGARRLALSEWEARVRALPGVEDVLAGSIERKGGDSVLCAAVCTRQPLVSVRELLRAHLPTWQQPRRLLVFESFPQTVRGKTDTAHLRALLHSDTGLED